MGVRDLAPTAPTIGLAQRILVVLENGQVVDTILYGLASGLGNARPAVTAAAMFGVQTAINFIVPSGSGQAAMATPPQAYLVGVTWQTTVLAFQLGDGFTHMIVPTSVVLVGVLSLSGVSWPVWARWILPLRAVPVVLGLGALAVAVATGFAWSAGLYVAEWRRQLAVGKVNSVH